MDAPERLEFRPLNDDDKRLVIRTGQREVDKFLKDKALKRHKRCEARTRIAQNNEGQILAYYCLEVHGEPVRDVGRRLKSSTQKYTATFPCIQLSWMGVNEAFQRDKGLNLRYGEQTLVQAIATAKDAIEAAGAYALQLEAIDDEADAFFAAYGFSPYTDDNTKRRLMPAVEVLEAARRLEGG